MPTPIPSRLLSLATFFFSQLRNKYYTPVRTTHYLTPSQHIMSLTTQFIPHITTYFLLIMLLYRFLKSQCLSSQHKVFPHKIILHITTHPHIIHSPHHHTCPSHHYTCPHPTPQTHKFKALFALQLPPDSSSLLPPRTSHQIFSHFRQPLPRKIRGTWNSTRPSLLYACTAV